MIATESNKSEFVEASEILTAEMLQTENAKLEESNSSMANKIKNLQNFISERKIKSQKVFGKSDELRKKLAIVQTHEKSLLNELTFLESEKEKLNEKYNKVASDLEANILLLGSSMNDIGFIKGETSSLIERMNMLKSKAPGKSSDLEMIDEIIGQAIVSLKDLYDRMQGIEKNVKINYYKNKKN
ncbi:MAG: hypothetical protein HQK79_11360 [Desulfobacterales bacterium]|nr:hypothetical protein [Desulfobacterales bacterium]